MTLWGGRFEEGPSDVLWSYTTDETDRRLLVDDVEGSIAHAGMLADVGILAPDEHVAVHAGLLRILEEARSETFEFGPGDEDVHTAVERRLIELVGDVGRKLHTGRSRNDQVALDLRLYLRRAAAARATQLQRFGLTLVEMAERYREVVVPSYTHLQQAQAVPLGHHLLAYAWMAQRDRSRFLAVRDRLGVSPLGAGASGGSSLPLDPIDSARRLGLDVVFANSMDAVGSRDLVAEYVWCCAQTMVSASRLSEELILWATEEFGWVRFSDAHTTGSSALPQKKNPDIAELARGRAAGVIGDLTAILSLQKGLPLTYNRDDGRSDVRSSVPLLMGDRVGSRRGARRSRRAVPRGSSSRREARGIPGGDRARAVGGDHGRSARGRRPFRRVGSRTHRPSVVGGPAGDPGRWLPGFRHRAGDGPPVLAHPGMRAR
jgi:argininosuccinate lyase